MYQSMQTTPENTMVANISIIVANWGQIVPLNSQAYISINILLSHNN